MNPKKVKPERYKGVLFIRGLSNETKSHFKAMCARKGVTMTEMIERLIWNAVHREARGDDYK